MSPSCPSPSLAESVDARGAFACRDHFKPARRPQRALDSPGGRVGMLAPARDLDAERGRRRGAPQPAVVGAAQDDRPGAPAEVRRRRGDAERPASARRRNAQLPADADVTARGDLLRDASSSRRRAGARPLGSSSRRRSDPRAGLRAWSWAKRSSRRGDRRRRGSFPGSSAPGERPACARSRPRRCPRRKSLTAWLSCGLTTQMSALAT